MGWYYYSLLLYSSSEEWTKDNPAMIGTNHFSDLICCRKWFEEVFLDTNIKCFNHRTRIFTDFCLMIVEISSVCCGVCVKSQDSRLISLQSGGTLHQLLLSERWKILTLLLSRTCNLCLLLLAMMGIPRWPSWPNSGVLFNLVLMVISDCSSYNSYHQMWNSLKLMQASDKIKDCQFN